MNYKFSYYDVKEDEILIFVYGTLKKGFHNHRMIKDAKFVGRGKTKDKYVMYVDIIPYVSKRDRVSNIYGEVYCIDRNTLDMLDRLEKHPCWYYREKVDVILEDGRIVNAWMYFNDIEVGNVVESGIYE
ncbi:MAG: gamma-glutamylcyclotransferase [Brevinematales bacterium]|nr:gamma-glutamylcyclotransferase [Brevinematales bacterium]